MLGIALGAFTQGFAQGMQLGVQMHDIRKQRQLEGKIEDITTQGKAEYEQGVAAGTQQPRDFASYYNNELVPQIANTYLEAGDPGKAQAWTDWADASSTKKAAKKFTSGLNKLQLGDTQGGIDDMIAAANTSGYGPEGKMTAAEYYDEEAGAVTGYRLTFETADGQTHTKNVAAADLPAFFANTVNPQAAFEMEQQQKANEAKADLEVKTHVRKKAAEAELGVGTGALTEAQYQNAIQEERKRIEDSALTDEEVGAMTSDEREQLAKDTVDKRFGRTPIAPAGPQVAVDPETGEQVEMPAEEAPAPTDEELGAQPAEGAPQEVVPTSQLGVTPADQAAPQQAAQAGVQQPAAPPSPDQAATPAAATSQVDPNQQQQYLAQASQLIKQGGNAQAIAQQLIAAGIPPQNWPQDVRLAARNSQLGVG